MKKNKLLNKIIISALGLTTIGTFSTMITSCGNTNDQTYEPTYYDFFDYILNNDGETYAISTNWNKSTEYTKESFNEEVIIPSEYEGKPITQINDGFLMGCTMFNNKIVIPFSIKTIGERFLQECESFNQSITFPNSLEILGAHFLQKCHVFNQQLVFPKSLHVIDTSFLYECKSFDKPIIVHENIEKIRDHFMYKCSNFTNLTVNCNQENFASCNYTCGTVDDSDICYQKGITISGNHDLIEVIKAYFSNRSQLPYCRKLNFQEI